LPNRHRRGTSNSVTGAGRRDARRQPEPGRALVRPEIEGPPPRRRARFFYLTAGVAAGIVVAVAIAFAVHLHAERQARRLPADVQTIDRSRPGAYRHTVQLISGDPAYRGPIDPGGASGPFQEIQTDARGRIIKVVSRRGSETVSARLYQFAGAEPLPNEYQDVRDGASLRRSRLDRDPSGRITRFEFFTAGGGEPTGLTVRSYGPVNVESREYSATGQEIAHYVDSYAENGILIHRFWYRDGSFHDEIEFDEHTGHWTSLKHFDHGQFLGGITYAYDADGALIRDTIYDRDMRWSKTRGYRDGLWISERFKLPDGVEQEATFTYDDERRQRQARLVRGDQLICVFRYVRREDGRLRTTLAHGPRGELFAEYPDRFVYKVERSGQPLEGHGGVIRRTQSWW
jgi:hypothetical protein